VKFVIRCVEQMKGGEIFVPKIPSMRMLDLANSIAQGCEIETVGIRPGEKLHEALVSEDEARHTVEVGDMYVIQPSYAANGKGWMEGSALTDGFRYASDTNSRWLSEEDLRELIADFDPDKSTVPA
jgi:UDP-N-acetylglucosamine 4,6-dehydratase